MQIAKAERTEARQHGQGVVTCEFSEITSPGLYIENKSGMLFRIPEDALVPGRSPALEVLCNEPWIVTRISPDPYLPLTKARMLAADLDLHINF